jgi:Flp pilus assembly protein TadD
MMKIGRSLIAVLVLSALVTGLSGCKKKEGPMERTGKEIDKAAEKTGDKLEKAGENVKDAVKDLKK